ncbi:hypothetical protein GQ43DRAFT_437797 [Delitschia confertaspora ATCC 74209]|uniref:Uncharacterized protein n=1 Tax=Delitschia confertaspora ATCC 74209 TaxID=1513339 RepID=A0A9P4JXY3_9PLEO|nr:hypothetical protein GQ43DRAFT_437797 [Delitschia confertaspora ATCC 74209]
MLHTFLPTLLLLSFSLIHPTTADILLRQNTQNPTIPTNPNSPSCLLYAHIANLSTIASNSTYRSAYLQLSPSGSIAVARVLNSAALALPPMMRNASLNLECGNWSEIAVVEAERNFTRGIVGEFGGLVGNPQEIKAGVELIGIMIAILGMFGGVWCFMP